jgi:LysR family transcriptional regulator, glycine cleavage system transcriptional activator
MLGVVLFRRTPKGLELTGEAEAGLEALRQGFLQFEESVRAMQAGQSSQSLTIAAPRDFTAKWLAPRLARYSQSAPDVRFTLVASDDGIDFTEANLDLAILWADNAGEHEGLALNGHGLIEVTGPDGKGQHVISWPGSLHADSDPLLRLGDAGLAIDAAANGLGRAIVPALLAAGDLASGRVQQMGEAVHTSKAYWLVAPLPQWRQAKVKALVAALSADD